MTVRGEGNQLSREGRDPASCIFMGSLDLGWAWSKEQQRDGPQVIQD